MPPQIPIKKSALRLKRNIHNISLVRHFEYCQVTQQAAEFEFILNIFNVRNLYNIN